MKIPMYTMPIRSSNVPVEIQLTEADLNHFKASVSSLKRTKSQNSLQDRSSLLKTQTKTNEKRIGADYQADLPSVTGANKFKEKGQGTLLWQPPTDTIADIQTYFSSVNARTSQQKEQALTILMGQHYKVKDAFATVSNLPKANSLKPQ